MADVSKTINLAGSRTPYGEDGGPLAATDYEFEVNRSSVIVRVHHGAIQTLGGGRLSPGDVKLAARTLLEMKTANGLDVRAGLVLDRGAMFVVAQRLGWLGRFRKTFSS